MKNVKCSYGTNPSSQLQITQPWESWGQRPIAADELSTANFSACARHYERNDFICSQNMSYSFESWVNTAGILEGWQVANKFGKKVRNKCPKCSQRSTENISNYGNDSFMTTVVWCCFWKKSLWSCRKPHLLILLIIQSVHCAAWCWLALVVKDVSSCLKHWVEEVAKPQQILCYRVWHNGSSRWTWLWKSTVVLPQLWLAQRNGHLLADGGGLPW